MLFKHFEAKIDPLSFDGRGHVMSWRMDNWTMQSLSFVFGEMLHAYERQVRESGCKDSKIFAENAKEMEEKLDLMLAEQENEDYSTLAGILFGLGFLLVLISFGARRKKGSKPTKNVEKKVE